MKRLVAISAKEGAALTKATQQIDLAKDAKALRLRFSSEGALVDDADPQGLLHTMDSMLVQMSGRHVNVHLNNHRKRQETKAVAQLLKNNKDCAHSTLKELEYGNPSAAPQDLLLSLFDATVKVAGLKASLETAASLGRDLEARVTQALKAKEEMTAKYDKIHRFEDHVMRGAAELKTLALGLSMSKAVLEQENSDLTAMVEEALARISLPTLYVKDSLTEELDTALQSPIHAIRLNSVPCSVVTSGSCLDLESVSDAVPFLAAWDKIIDALRQKKLRICQEETEVSAVTQILDVMMLHVLETKDISTRRLKDLQASVGCQDRAIENQVLPLLGKVEERHAIMKLNLEQLKDTIEEWWTQPGPLVKEFLKQPSA